MWCFSWLAYAFVSSPSGFPVVASGEGRTRLRGCLRRRHGQAPWKRNMPKTRHGARVRTEPFPTAKPSPFQAPFGRFSAESLPVQIEYDAGVASGRASPSAVDAAIIPDSRPRWKRIFQRRPADASPACEAEMSSFSYLLDGAGISPVGEHGAVVTAALFRGS